MILFIKSIFWLSLFLLGYTYVVYPLILSVLDRRIKRFNFISNHFQPKVSIVIAAYNEEKVIRGRIENCLALDYPLEKLEIIIGSDGSDDKTSEIVKEYAQKGVVLYPYQERHGKVNVLNKIVPKTCHDIVVFSDANTMFQRDAIKNLIRHFKDPKVGCVCGGLHFVKADGSVTAELEGIYWKYETLIKKMEGRRGSLLGANGAIYAVRKALYEQCPEDTIIEDFVVPMKILQRGYKVNYDPEAIAMEETTKKFIQEKQRRIRIGAGDFQALFRLLPMLNPFNGFSALAFWSHKVLRWFAPFFLIIGFALNLLLVMEPLYLVLFILQCVFYGAAFIGQVLSWSGFSVKIFNLCYYFVSMNLAILLGFVRFVTGGQSVAWQRTER